MHFKLAKTYDDFEIISAHNPLDYIGLTLSMEVNGSNHSVPLTLLKLSPPIAMGFKSALKNKLNSYQITLNLKSVAFQKEHESELLSYHIDEVTKIGRYSSPNTNLLGFASSGSKSGGHRRQVARPPPLYLPPEPLVSQTTPYMSGTYPSTPSTNSPPENNMCNDFESLRISSNERPW